MTFQSWWAAGVTDLHPIIPLRAALSPLTRLTERDLGKIPGLPNAKGEWRGFNWTRHVTTEAECRTWDTYACGIGVRTANFPAIDIDCEDPELVTAIGALILQRFGELPWRDRKGSIRSLFLGRTAHPFRRMRVWMERDGKSQLVEVLGAGQQAVLEGEHSSGETYSWYRPISALEDLPVFTAESMDAFLTDVEAVAGQLGYTATREGRVSVTTERTVADQAELRSTVSFIRSAVAHIPNTNDRFPSRTDYLKMGYAIKAACGPDHEADAFAIWWSWCERWEGNGRTPNTREVAAEDWARLRPPFTLGASWVFEQAHVSGYHEAVDVFNDGLYLEPAPPEEEDEGAETKTPGAQFSDAWLAGQFLAFHGEQVRFCQKLGGWMVWDGHRWSVDETGHVAEWAGEICRTAACKAENSGERKRLGGEPARQNTLAYARTNQAVSVGVDAFDSDPWSLNTPEGIIDLKSGQLGPADASRLFTRCTAVAPDASQTPRKWLDFLREATGGDSDLEAYLQQMAGYALTGSTREHALMFLWGPGGNGKGVFLNTLVRIFGSYAAVSAMDTFTSSSFDRHPADIASLFGARMVTAQETQEGRSWDEAKVKSITGGDPVSARYMRQNFFTFTPQFKLLFAGNHKPRIHNLDDAMRRRFHLIPFTNIPAKRNLNLKEELEEEWPGILAWAVEGCVAWQQQGLIPPLVVREATEAYFIDEDPMGRWMSERTMESEEGTGEGTLDLFADWTLWCQERSEKHGTERTFAQALLSRGLPKWRDARTRRRGVGKIRLRPGSARFESE